MLVSVLVLLVKLELVVLMELVLALCCVDGVGEVVCAIKGTIC